MERIKMPIIMIAPTKTNHMTLSYQEITDKNTAIKLSATDIVSLFIVDDGTLTDLQKEAMILIIKHVSYSNLKYKCTSDDLLVKDRLEILNLIFPEKKPTIRSKAFTGGRVKEL